MTPNEYWKRELDKASELAFTTIGTREPQILGVLIIAGQLQALNRTLSEIRAQLQGIEDSINS